MTPIYLSDISPKDKRWDKQKQRVDNLFNIFAQTGIGVNYQERLGKCGSPLKFKLDEDKLKLVHANFCHVRGCPICTGRRELKLRAKLAEKLPEMLDKNPKYRFLFMTLTVKNPHISELNKTLKAMSHAWQKLTQRKEFKTVKGFLRRLEITRPKANPDEVHPHYHCLLVVPEYYFHGHSYISQKKLIQLWKECLKADYEPSVDIRRVKPKKDALIGTTVENAEVRAVLAAIQEVVKYSTKEYDSVPAIASKGDKLTESDIYWIEQLFYQTERMRFTSLGGVIREYCNVDELELTDEELIHINEDGVEVYDPVEDGDNESTVDLWFVYSRNWKRYIYRQINDSIKQVDTA